MNILIDKLPRDYNGLKIETNFRSFILFELLMQDSELDIEEKIELSLKLFYKNIKFESVNEMKKAVNGILYIYSLGRSETKNKKETKKEGYKKQTAIYSYEHDANLIYSAFLSQYRIDLNEIEYLHWWKFRSLFEGLNDNNKICEIMGYRAIDISKIKDESQRKHYQKLKQKFALPDNRSEEEKEEEFANALW